MERNQKQAEHEAYVVRSGDRKAEVRANPDVGCYIVSLFRMPTELESGIEWRLMGTHRREQFASARAWALRWVDRMDDES